MVSMKDVAKECGVSVATVSKALNGYSDVGAEKRREIKEAARRMGYLPNLSARALKTKRTYNLGILFVDEAQSGLTHDYFSSIIESFKVTAEAKGYDITFVNCSVPKHGRSYYEHCRYRGLEHRDRVHRLLYAGGAGADPQRPAGRHDRLCVRREDVRRLG